MKISIKYETKPISEFIDIEHFDIKDSGVYLIYDGTKKLLYVGKAKNLKTRVYSHYNATFDIYNERANYLNKLKSKHYKYIRYFIIEEEYNRSSVEQKLIQKLQPEFNLQYANYKDTQRFNDLRMSAEHLYMIDKYGTNYEQRFFDIYDNL